MILYINLYNKVILALIFCPLSSKTWSKDRFANKLTSSSFAWFRGRSRISWRSPRYLSNAPLALFLLFSVLSAKLGPASSSASSRNGILWQMNDYSKQNKISTLIEHVTHDWCDCFATESIYLIQCNLINFICIISEILWFYSYKFCRYYEYKIIFWIYENNVSTVFMTKK